MLIIIYTMLKNLQASLYSSFYSFPLILYWQKELLFVSCIHFSLKVSGKTGIPVGNMIVTIIISTSYNIVEHMYPF